ncbi:hypothetical protein HS125_03075 [bacterium]|nr:hypothetical protein [bacterium]
MDAPGRGAQPDTYTTGYPLYMLLAVPGLRLPAPVESSTAFYASLLPVVAAVLPLLLRAAGDAIGGAGAGRRDPVRVVHGVWLAATSVYVHGIALLAQWALYAALYHYERHPTPRRWLLVVAALGAGGCAHPLNLLLALPVLTWMWPMLRRRSLPRRYWAWSALILLLGLADLYLPATSPRGARGDLRNLSGLFFYLTGEGRSATLPGATPGTARASWPRSACAGCIRRGSSPPRRAPSSFCRGASGWSALLVSQALLLLFITVCYSTGHPQFYACFLIGLFWLWVAGSGGLWRLLRGLAAKSPPAPVRPSWPYLLSFKSPARPDWTITCAGCGPTGAPPPPSATPWLKCPALPTAPNSGATASFCPGCKPAPAAKASSPPTVATSPWTGACP